MSGDIIFLNGTSSAGKSTLAKALQTELNAPYLHTGIDHFMQALPKDSVMLSDVKPEAMPTDKLAVAVFQNNRMVAIYSGLLNRRLREGLYRSVAALADSGINVIVDDVLFEPWMVETAVSILASYTPLFVRVYCPLSVAEAYEKKRRDRALGGAALFYDPVYAIKPYDLEVDTSKHDPAACAQIIHGTIKNKTPRTAFHQMSS